MYETSQDTGNTVLHLEGNSEAPLLSMGLTPILYLHMRDPHLGLSPAPFYLPTHTVEHIHPYLAPTVPHHLDSCTNLLRLRHSRKIDRRIYLPVLLDLFLLAVEEVVGRETLGSLLALIPTLAGD